MKKILFPALILFISAACKAQSPDFVWAKQMSGTANEAPLSIVLDGSGNVYTAGYFKGTADFDPGANTFNLSSPGVEAVYISKLDAQGNFLWAKQISGSTQLGPSLTHGGAMAISATGNLYLTGYFEGGVDFDPGAGMNLMYAGNSGSNAFVLKLDGAGNFIWARHWGGPNGDLSNAIAIDGQENVYTTGLFMDLADFDPGAGTYTMTTTNGAAEAFVSKLDAAGNFVWARQLVTTTVSGGNAVAVEAAGNVYVTGAFTGLVDLDPGIASFTANAATQDAYLLKLDVGGNFVWAKTMGGSGIDGGDALVIDAANICLGGFFSGTVDLDPGAGTYTVSSAGNYDQFISKFDALGNLVWARVIGGTGNDVVGALAVGSNGDLYGTGEFAGTVDFDPGAGIYNLSAAGRDASVFKLDGLGNFKWAKQLPGSTFSGGSAIAVDAVGNVFTTGQFSTTVDFDPGNGAYNLTAFAETDAYVHKMSCGNTPNLTASGASIICQGNSATLTASGASSYTWNTNPGSSMLVVSPTLTTTYTVNGTDANGCTASAKVTQSVSACTGIEMQEAKDWQLSVYPNPGKGLVMVEAGLAGGNHLSIQVMNALGQLMLLQEASGTTAVDTSQLPSGLYLISLLQSHHKLASRKLIIQH